MSATGYEASVILADGSPAEVRVVRKADRAGVLALHETASDLSLYRRFFTLNRPRAAEYAEKLCLAGDGSLSLVVIRRQQVVGVATAMPTRTGVAEVALLVDERLHAVGIGTVLLEHLASWCSSMGVRRFTADVLVDNTGMIRVFHDAGFAYVEQVRHGVMSLSLDLAVTPARLRASAGRQRQAEAHSMAHILEPAAVAVVGAQGGGALPARRVLDNIRRGGFAGPVHACDSVGELPRDLDLAVVEVPGGAASGVVAELARRGTNACVLLTPQQDPGHQLVGIAREHGIRVVGPNSSGVLSHLRGTRLDATGAVVHPGPGRLALAAQAGGAGDTVLEAVRHSAVGLACFVSTGEEADVSGTDLLMAWTDDPAVGAAALALQSVPDPGQLARAASPFSSRKPVVAFVGRSPDRALAALYDAAGLIRADDPDDLLDTGRVLAEQPLPGGRRLGVVGDATGLPARVGDAAARAGLEVSSLIGGVSGSTLRELLSDDAADAVIVVSDAIAVTGVREVVAGLEEAVRTQRAASSATKPVVLVAPALNRMAGECGALTVLDSVEGAVRALGHAVGYTGWLSTTR
ncbi:MAG TPA: GNAT family N-acetyltransferase [Marmoricola sp.]